MADEFRALDQTLASLVGRVSPPGRRQLARRLSLVLRQSQKRRIASQKNADGSGYEGRKSQSKTVQRRVQFIYNGQLREIVNWSGNRKHIIGADTARHEVRTFLRSRIERYISVDDAQVLARRGRSKTMFRGLRTRAYLRATSTPDVAAVGYHGVAARIANIHQYGLKDNVNKHIETWYPVRELLGITTRDDDAILNETYAFIARR